MREKRRARRGSEATPPDTESFDAGATARQVGLFESANGVPNGLVAVIAAFVIAAISYPIYRLRRRR
jgi:hypothetical protein